MSARSTTATVLLSGGLDSAAAAVFFLEQGLGVTPLFVDYEQPAVRRERSSAELVARHLGLRLTTVGVSGLQVEPGFISGRNAMLLSLALCTIRPGPTLIVSGIHGGTSYPDCTEAFVQEGQALCDIYHRGAVQFVAPFLNWTKDAVARYLLAKAPGIIGLTTSCESEGEGECGGCLSCLDLRRLRAGKIL